MANKRLSPVRTKIALYLLFGFPAFIFIVYLYPAQAPLGGLMLALGFLGVFLGKNTLVCENCGKRRINIAVETECCHSCGRRYFPAAESEEPNK